MNLQGEAHVAVVGGGISGLAAAYRLRRSLGPRVRITVIEQSQRLGGKLRTTELAGTSFDVGAEAFLSRRPEIHKLADELGLSIVHPGQYSATVFAGGRPCPLPARTLMGIPSSVDSARNVLSPEGIAALSSEPDLPAVRLEGGDVAVGELLRARVGDEVVDRLVEPLLGGVYAGSADGLGLRATIPALAVALDAGAESISAAVTKALPPSGPSVVSTPVFGAIRGGYRELVERLVRESSAEIRLGLPVRSLSQGEGGWKLEVGSAPNPGFVEADAVVLAVPAPSARRLLDDVVAVAAAEFGRIELASMAVVSLAFPPNTELPSASGVLIPRDEQRADGTAFTAKAFTFSSQKWPHLRGQHGEVLVRASVGRFGNAEGLRVDDDELISGVRADLAELAEVSVAPVDSSLIRWGGGLPQYGVGHLDAVSQIESALADFPGLAVAGAALHGVGVPACVATGEAAAAKVTDHLLTRS